MTIKDLKDILNKYDESTQIVFVENNALYTAFELAKPRMTNAGIIKVIDKGNECLVFTRGKQTTF